MGGRVAVIVRFESGEVLAWSHWTNSLPRMINTVALCENPESHLRQWFEEEALHDDFKQGKEHPRFGRVDSVYPISYGMVVLDLPNRQLLHHQGYTSLSRQHVSGLTNQWPRNFWDIPKDSTQEEARVFVAQELKKDYADPNRSRDAHWRPDPTDTTSTAARFRDMISAKRLEGLQVWDEETQDRVDRTSQEVFGTPHPTVDQVFDYLYDHAVAEKWIISPVSGDRVRVSLDPHFSYGGFQYDMTPWTVQNFEGTEEGIGGLRTAMLDLGFELDEEKWTAYMGDIEPPESEE